MFFAKKFENFLLAVTSREVKGSITKLILMVDYIVFLLAEEGYYIKATSFGCCKKRCLAELVLDRWTEATLH